MPKLTNSLNLIMNMMTDHSLNQLLELVVTAGDAALKVQSQPQFKIEHKENDLGPVTEADKLVNEILTREIHKQFPHDLIVSEESDPPSQLSAERLWFLDPIDGTKEFISRDSGWSIMMGLVDRQGILFGLVYQPVTRQAWYAERGAGAFSIVGSEKRRSRLQARSVSRAQDAVLIQSRSHLSLKAKVIAESLGIRETIYQGSVGIKLCRIASGDADLYMNFSGKCHMWDLCPGQIILEEAGGTLYRLDGGKIDYWTTQFRAEYPLLAGARGLIPTISTRVAALAEQTKERS